MSEEELKQHWYPAYNDALKLIKNSELVSEKHIAQMVNKYGNTVLNRLFCLAVWQEIKRIKKGDTSLNKDQYAYIVADAWVMFKNYSSPSDSEKFWESLVDDIRSISQKYGSCRFVLDLLIHVTLEEIERIWREKKEGKYG